ncbi:DUF5818 domain-containing protein [Sphingomonas sp. SUN039]|uniref:DUF5818 domain-containing protein n=1 Tax=Sphingomonas sp. SUN039 TaxID=2937787 RepID=UPI002868546D|nr:DUF5818 domain-containing protein [Sphingomonas sp. SUN039]
MHTVDGLLLSGSPLPVLRVDGGGEWRLDMASRFYKLIGRRVRVTGTRGDFDLLNVTQVVLL